MLVKNRVWVLVAITFFAGASSLSRRDATAAEEQPKMDRAATLMWNLNRAAGSAGWYLLKAKRDTKTMDHDLSKAHHQIEEVDKTYAKLRGRPDDKFLTTALIKVERAENTRAQLEEDLRDAFDTLNDNIKETLMLDEERKKKK